MARVHVQKEFEVIILLAGGDKSTQLNDIKTALQLAHAVKGDK